MNRVYRVYKGLQDAGRDILLPAPPLESGDDFNQAFHQNHGVIDRPDPHKVEDRAKLLAQIEMDAQLEDLRQKQIQEQKQRVIPKPHIDSAQPLNNEVVKKPTSSEKSIVEMEKQHDDLPIIMGGEDRDADARKKRDKVKAVSFATQKIIGFRRAVKSQVKRPYGSSVALVIKSTFMKSEHACNGLWGPCHNSCPYRTVFIVHT